MTISLWQAALIALTAYLSVSVWCVGVGYFTLYRPLVAGTLVGLILGDLPRGMAFGAALNAVYLGFVSTGGSLPGDLAVAGYIGTALALASRLDVDAALAALGIPLSLLGGFLWFGRMTFGSILVRWADTCAERGDVRGVATVNLWAGQILMAVFYAIPTFLLVYYGQWGIDHLLTLIPKQLIQALSVVGGMLPAIGIGLLLRSIGKARLIPYGVIGFVLATYLDLPLLVLALLGAAAAWLTLWTDRPAQAPAAETPSPLAARPVPRRVLHQAWWRWMMFLHASYNYERLQGLGFAHTLAPVIAYLYPAQVERAAALKRHLVFFNTEPQIGALTPAVVITLEEQRAGGAPISDQAINSVKSGLMGPLAGVGDSLFQGLITPLLLALGIELAQQGYLAGPLLYAVSISIIVLASSYSFWMLGYRLGRAAVGKILATGWLKTATDGASLVGMMVVGGLTATVVQVSTPASLQWGSLTLSLQRDVLNTILRGLLPLALTGSVWWLLSRRVSPTRIMGLLFALGIDLAYLGLAGQTAPPLFSSEWLAFVCGADGKTPVTLWSALAHLWPPLTISGLIAIGWWRQRGNNKPGRL